MRAAIEAWLARRWYGGVSPGPGLRSASRLYRFLVSLRQEAAPVRLSVPVIVVGNFTAGGTGKTPLVIALARNLAARGFRPGIVSRGHGRRSALPIRVGLETSVDDAGDEPVLMFEDTGLPVLVDGNRVAAARAAIQAGCNLVIADDGLQHRRLGRDLEIEVVDGQRGYGNGLLLPAGPLREPPRPCDFRVVNGGDAPGAGAWAMQLRLTDAISLADRRTRKPLREFSGKPLHAFAAIGNPSRFFDALRAAGLDPACHAFEDHHAYGLADFANVSGAILMTAKDAVKCRQLGLADAWSVPVEAELPGDFLAAVQSRLDRLHA